MPRLRSHNQSRPVKRTAHNFSGNDDVVMLLSVRESTRAAPMVSLGISPLTVRSSAVTEGQLLFIRRRCVTIVRECEVAENYICHYLRRIIRSGDVWHAVST
ncbi:hypothetical protein E2C01_049816 [Portunus trituberculatus]|uniref:Uncharacterized protein n=1 Tax=Portunus trituberculatus TaxID=210409 RepID=A0A5B7G7D7_PORTR|nr:hypothetical protein [Portunus trituberculatus]